MDISEQCGHMLDEQIELFNGIKPLFANKPLLVVLNKVDVIRPEELSEEKKDLLKVFDQEGLLHCLYLYLKFANNIIVTEPGIPDVKN